jgi:hypothetical protein
MVLLLLLLLLLLLRQLYFTLQHRSTSLKYASGLQAARSLCRISWS